MKRGKLLHAELSGLIAAMGHGDLLVIGDAGLPVPPGVRVIDLALTHGIPGFFEVLDTILAEFQVERSVIAAEASAHLQAAIRAKVPGAVDIVSHRELKELTQQARAVVRTGEFTPYANICLYAGVVF